MFDNNRRKRTGDSQVVAVRVVHSLSLPIDMPTSSLSSTGATRGSTPYYTQNLRFLEHEMNEVDGAKKSSFACAGCGNANVDHVLAILGHECHACRSLQAAASMNAGSMCRYVEEWKSSELLG